MLTPRYHIHVDAASMPMAYRDKLLQEFGLKLDNFEHAFMIDGVSYPGEHFTRYVFENNKEEVRETCQKLSRLAEDYEFKGLIQCEFIVDDFFIQGSAEDLPNVCPPFLLTRRIVSAKSFKKHELHLELQKSGTAPAIIRALMETGLETLENEREITFTASGNTRELLTIKSAIGHFLEKYQGHVTGRFTYEATAYWSLHRLDQTTLPKSVEKVILQ